MTDNEMLQAIKQLLDPIRKNQEEMKLQIEGLQLQVNTLNHEVKRGFWKTDQDIETLVEVLEAKGILPKAQ
ncbi:MAG TPA: hypothetical protein IAC37_02265 [Candidatus Ventrimonas merdavium]|nr:hypothetical protein [Candidatus Ventrimonas merdavium]